jgi:CheY-like chemotaxis protein
MTRRILIIEDSDEDFYGIQRVVERRNADVEISRSSSGDEALDRLLQIDAAPGDLLPDVILLDLNLPGADGRTVLRQIRAHGALNGVPVVIFSTSSSQVDIVDCYRNGASAYCVKPVGFVDFERTVSAISEFWFETVRFSDRGGFG